MQRAPLESLGAIEKEVWRELAACVRKPEHGWRVATLATVDGGRADARSVVLREVEPARRRLVFFADARSPKVRHIEAQPDSAMVMWSRELGWQLRLGVRLEVLTSGLTVSSRWARLKMTPAAQDYLSPLPPGSVIDSDKPTPERSTREHFAVVIASVQRVDWTELGALGHRRALFDGEGARWLQP